jgi:hypothetical protein
VPSAYLVLDLCKRPCEIGIAGMRKLKDVAQFLDLEAVGVEIFWSETGPLRQFCFEFEGSSHGMATVREACQPILNQIGTALDMLACFLAPGGDGLLKLCRGLEAAGCEEFE